MNANQVLVERLAAELRRRSARVATAESCTGGWIAKTFTDLPGSSDWFEFGFVSYGNNAKAAMLNVDAALIEQHGAVSREVAEAMVAGALEASGAWLALAVTGIAGPEGGSAEKPVGDCLVCIPGRRPAGAVCLSPVRRRSRYGAAANCEHRVAQGTWLCGAGVRLIMQGTKKRRLFFALWPDAHIRSQVADQVARAIESGAADGRRVPPANYHITLAFLGSVSASSMADIVAAAGRVRFLPFNLDLVRTGYWPNAKVAWLAPENCPPFLQTLVDDLWNRLADLGLQREERPYLPHLTLARRTQGGLGMRLDSPIAWQVSSFVLAESTGGPDGPVYTVLEEFTAGD